MRILVVGMGQVGRYLVQYLARDGHDLVVIDNSSEALEAITEMVDVQTVVGHGSAQKVLQTAEAGAADICIAATDSDEVNILAALSARKLGVRRTIARVANRAYYTNPGGYERGVLGVDLIINPQILAASEIHRTLRAATGVLELRRFADNRVEMVSMDIKNETRWLGKPLREVPVPPGALVVAVERGDKLVVPRGDTVVEMGNRLHLLGDIDTLPRMEELFGLERRGGLKHVIIAGCGEVGFEVARTLELDGIDTTVIEIDEDRAELVSGELSKALVLHGDARDLALLKQEGIERTDAFLALTREDEINMMTSLVAKDLGARRVISLMHRSDAIAMCRRYGIEASVSPRRATAEHILRQVRVRSCVSVALVNEGAGEILEIVVPESCRAVGRDLMYLEFPSGALVGTVVRDGSVWIPSGTDALQPNDTVLVFALPEARPAIEDLFRERSGA